MHAGADHDAARVLCGIGDDEGSRAFDLMTRQQMQQIDRKVEELDRQIWGASTTTTTTPKPDPDLDPDPARLSPEHVLWRRETKKELKRRAREGRISKNLRRPLIVRIKGVAEAIGTRDEVWATSMSMLFFMTLLMSEDRADVATKPMPR